MYFKKRGNKHKNATKIKGKAALNFCGVFVLIYIRSFQDFASFAVLLFYAKD
jgi:hypothetical protein